MIYSVKRELTSLLTVSPDEEMAWIDGRTRMGEGLVPVDPPFSRLQVNLN